MKTYTGVAQAWSIIRAIEAGRLDPRDALGQALIGETLAALAEVRPSSAPRRASLSVERVCLLLASGDGRAAEQALDTALDATPSHALLDIRVGMSVVAGRSADAKATAQQYGITALAGAATDVDMFHAIDPAFVWLGDVAWATPDARRRHDEVRAWSSYPKVDWLLDGVSTRQWLLRQFLGRGSTRAPGDAGGNVWVHNVGTTPAEVSIRREGITTVSRVLESRRIEAMAVRPGDRLRVECREPAREAACTIVAGDVILNVHEGFLERDER